MDAIPTAATDPAQAETSTQTTPAATGPETGWILAQRLVFPDPTVNSRIRLFCHGVRGAGHDAGRQAYFARPGARLKLDSYFNCFHASAMDLGPRDAVVLRLEGEGDALVKVQMARPLHSDETLLSTVVTLKPGRPVDLTLPPIRDAGVIHLRFNARTRLNLTRADWLVQSRRARHVKIGAVITTFKRNDAVQASTARLADYMEANPDIGDRLSVFVVDNGGDTDAAPGARVIKNRNLGGAGGFTRGLLEHRKDPDVTHVLFMDDDAEFFPENLRRTLAVLRLARPKNTAVAGTMLPASKRWQVWENTAIFDKLCRPILQGLNLRKFENVLELARPLTGVQGRYAGWWYFCFPLSHVKRLAFPFFVRGDDVWFSLANDFDIRTVLGVCSHQDDFVSKRSPLTAYLDARYHVIQMLAHDGLPSDAATLKDQLTFLYRQWNESYHYGAAAAVIEAIEDVCKGPEFFDEDPEMSAKRARIKEIGGEEATLHKLKWRRSGNTGVAPAKHTSKPYQILRLITCNGHRWIPKRFFYSKTGRFDMDTRARPNQVFLRENCLVVDAQTSIGYRLKRDPARFFENRRRFEAAFRQLVAKLPELRKAYKVDQLSQITEEAWRKRLGL